MADNNPNDETDRLAAIITRQVAQVLPTLVTQLNNSYQNSPSGSQYHPTQNNGENSNSFTFKQFNDARPKTFSGVEGATGLIQWFESIEDTLDYTNCPEDQKVKMAASTFQQGALTWWNGEKKSRGREAALSMSWTDFKALLVTQFCPKHEMKNLEDELYNLVQVSGNNRTYTNRFQELSILVPHMVTPVSRQIDKYIGGLPLLIRSMVMGSKPTTLQSAIHLAADITNEFVKGGQLTRTDDVLPAVKEEKKLTEPSKKKQRTNKSFAISSTPSASINQAPSVGDSTTNSRRSYVGPYPLCNNCKYHHPFGRQCWKCTKCGRYGHLGQRCQFTGKVVNATTSMAASKSVGPACYECGATGNGEQQQINLGQDQQQN
ncbi:hypothetical protein E3N88_29418 [Mikania micrantha]|uniref:CCHC-type domain-containing protein n=1 Tax=Mikania micrantha TaxID=192012 RepID=A0A5N6MIS3_9ASTR|nr:hypothetical protein E3N88_29418 [Mikania micrantha]